MRLHAAWAIPEAVLRAVHAAAGKDNIGDGAGGDVDLSSRVLNTVQQTGEDIPVHEVVSGRIGKTLDKFVGAILEIGEVECAIGARRFRAHDVAVDVGDRIAAGILDGDDRAGKQQIAGVVVAAVIFVDEYEPGEAIRVDRRRLDDDRGRRGVDVMVQPTDPVLPISLADRMPECRASPTRSGWGWSRSGRAGWCNRG